MPDPEHGRPAFPPNFPHRHSSTTAKKSILSHFVARKTWQIHRKLFGYRQLTIHRDIAFYATISSPYETSPMMSLARQMTQPAGRTHDFARQLANFSTRISALLLRHRTHRAPHSATTSSHHSFPRHLVSRFDKGQSTKDQGQKTTITRQRSTRHPSDTTSPKKASPSIYRR
jgi:hypothetical protein